MPENTRVEDLVRNAVNHALERQMESLRESVVQEVLREMGSAQAGKAERAESSSATLQKAVLAIQSGTNQKEILRALLDNTVLYSERAALFVIKAGAATGWQGTSFSHNDAIKDFSVDVSSGLAARVMQSRSAEFALPADMDFPDRGRARADQSPYAKRGQSVHRRARQGQIALVVAGLQVHARRRGFDQRNAQTAAVERDRQARADQAAADDEHVISVVH